ncbi:preprotein translocase subunit YajC [Nonomuraea gerenzanensis]|uniref:Preprotein translocase subunit YajC (TC 3.A.5.1.1) n=1 Tax=Nonomuraea gerenzanensis TaxID=93944 RepID=A0A1M4EHB9_9ACTN|nr:preprotein translocase subunit YajC [Nonomuraea gerenzanensis]UBU09904.1 preprotein translocase subunit YajC [Nonomuraea gerenzanensis]SBO98357.1 Preprotein translocase subunit YajC (TC 3.A.5.1.1) [Nonomuraea gerenzanensis]
MDMGQLGSILPLILLVVVFYFLLIRPQRKRQQEAIQMQNSLTPGSRVMTTTGLFATVVAVDNEDVVLEVAPGIETRWVKAAIGRVVAPGDAPVSDDESAADQVELDEEGKKESEATVERDGDQGSSTKQS